MNQFSYCTIATFLFIFQIHQALENTITVFSKTLFTDMASLSEKVHYKKNIHDDVQRYPYLNSKTNKQQHNPNYLAVNSST